jgi:hypothetical protein
MGQFPGDRTPGFTGIITLPQTGIECATIQLPGAEGIRRQTLAGFTGHCQIGSPVTILPAHSHQSAVKGQIDLGCHCA